MFKILNMGLLDICWGVPFLYLSIVAMINYFDSKLRIRNVAKAIAYHKSNRDKISSCMKTGDLTSAEVLINTTSDPLIKDSGSVLKESLKSRFEDYGALKDEMKESVDNLLKVPHSTSLDEFAAVILVLGFSGTLLSFFYTLINFDMNNEGFLQLFTYLAVGIKSSFFAACASGLMGSLHARLREKVEAEKKMLNKETFYKDLIYFISHPPSKKTTRSPGTNNKEVLKKEFIGTGGSG